MKKYIAILAFIAVFTNFYNMAVAKTNNTKVKKTASVKKAETGIVDVQILSGCIGCGACADISSKVFRVDNVSHVNKSRIPGHESEIRTAAKACPVEAIKIISNSN